MKKSKKQEVKSFTNTLIEQLRPAIIAMDKDNRVNEEEFLNAYLSKYYPLKPGQRISSTTIEYGILKPFITIELRDNEGNIKTTNLPYQETLNQAREQKEKSDKKIMEASKKIEVYTKRVIEVFQQAQSTNNITEAMKVIPIIKKLLEIMKDLSNKKGTMVFSEQEQKKYEHQIDEIENLTKEQGYAWILEMDKYQIPTINTLLNKLQEYQYSLDDFRYFEVAINYLKEKDKNASCNEKFLSLSKKLTLAYDKYTLRRLNDCKLILLTKNGLLGENIERLKTEQSQQQLRKIMAIKEKLENKEEVTREEMIEYVFSLDGYKKEDIDQKVLRVAPQTIENLELLKAQFPKETLLDESIAMQKRYNSFANKVHENRQEAIADVSKFALGILKDQEENAQVFLKSREEFKMKSHSEEQQFLDVCISYLQETASNNPVIKEQEKQMIVREIVYPKEQLKKIDKALEVAENLEMGIAKVTIQDIFSMSILVENYMIASELINDSQNTTGVMNDVLDYIRGECQEIDSWDQAATQQIKQDKLDIPKEKLLQKGLTV